ncbi:MAG: nuclear transport factor 2 family protein [Alphaproteobacteria bacterium]
MTLEEKIIAAVEGYIEGFSNADVDAIVALYAEGATVEDPVGSPLKEGSEVRAFYENSVATGAKLSLDGPIRVAGNEAAFAFTARVNFGDEVHEINVIDTMQFDDEGKIVKMRAFFGQSNMKQVA